MEGTVELLATYLHNATETARKSFNLSDEEARDFMMEIFDRITVPLTEKDKACIIERAEKYEERHKYDREIEYAKRAAETLELWADEVYNDTRIVWDMIDAGLLDAVTVDDGIQRARAVSAKLRNFARRCYLRELILRGVEGVSQSDKEREETVRVVGFLRQYGFDNSRPSYTTLLRLEELGYV